MYMLQFYSGYGEAGWGGGGVGPVVRALQDSGLIKRSRFRACWGHYVVFLGRILIIYSYSALLFIQVYKWVPSYLMLGVMLFVKGN